MSYMKSKHYILQQTINAGGRLRVEFLAESRNDAEDVAQTLATVLGLSLRLEPASSPAEHATFTPGAQGAEPDISAPLGVKAI